MAIRLKSRNLILTITGAALIAACGQKSEPRSVAQFLEDQIALEAAVVRCAQNRERTRYEAECVNARQAVSIIEAREDRARAQALEAESERKREALRRTQAAAAEARRLAAEAARQREEAEYHAQFGELPAAEEIAEPPLDPAAANVPGVAVEEPAEEFSANAINEESTQPDDANNAPGDLDAIREELQRRSETSSGSEPAQ